MNKERLFFYAVLLLSLAYVAYNEFFYKTVEVHSVDIPVVDTDAIVTKARIGWIEIDKIPKELRYKTVPRDSIVYDVRDSVNVIDSLDIHVLTIPYYQSDNVFNFEQNTPEYNFSARLELESKFYPDYESFEFKPALKDIKVDIIEQRRSNKWKYAAGALAALLIVNSLNK